MSLWPKFGDAKRRDGVEIWVVGWFRIRVVIVDQKQVRENTLVCRVVVKLHYIGDFVVHR